jgi:hypothetical protein
VACRHSPLIAALSQDEAALENLVLERGLPSVEFIWRVVRLAASLFSQLTGCRQARSIRAEQPIQVQHDRCAQAPVAREPSLIATFASK